MQNEENLLPEQLANISRDGGYAIRPLDLILLRGADRLRFLNGQVTCEVGKEPDAVAYGYFTSPKGRIECDALVRTEEDLLRLILPAGRGQAILERLRKYVITDRVEISLLPTSGLFLLGAAASDPFDRAGFVLAQPPIRLPELGIGRDLACSLLVADAPLAEGALDGSGLVDVGEAGWQQLRIEAGRPQFGDDFGSDHFPQEVGIAEAVSYTKGCYLGQEVVARIHYRGGVQKQLRGLRLEAAAGAALPPLPLSLLLEGKEVGKLTSLAPQPRGGWRLGLGIVHQKAEPGARLELADAEGGSRGVAELVPLPFPTG